MIDLIETYSTFNCIKLHFAGSFDVRKYGFRVKKFNGERLFKERTEYVFKKLSEKLQTPVMCRTVFAANLVRDPALFPTKVDESVAMTLRRYNGNKRILVDDIAEKISAGLLTNIKSGDIISDLYKGTMTIELGTFINKFINLTKLVDEYHSSDYAWKLIRDRLDKYSPFCLLDSTAQRDAIKSHIFDLLKQQHQTKNETGILLPNPA